MLSCTCYQYDKKKNKVASYMRFISIIADMTSLCGHSDDPEVCVVGELLALEAVAGRSG